MTEASPVDTDTDGSAGDVGGQRASIQQLAEVLDGWRARIDELMVQLDGENGADLSRTVKYQIPPGTAPGTLFFTVADGPQTSILELRQIAGETAHSPDQLISMVNKLRPSDKAYVRIWRPQPAYQVAGEELPDPPPSLSLVLGSTQGLTQNKNSKIAEIIIDAGEFMVMGSKTVQLEVK